MKLKIKRVQIRRFLYRLMASIDRFLGFENKQIVFSLHAISNGKWQYNNSAPFIRKLIKTMMTRGWQPGKLSELRKNTRWGRKNFYLTFDDGYKSVLTMAEFFKKNEIYPTAFLIGNTKERDLKQLTTSADIMDERDIRVLKKYGWEFGSHSMTHRNFYEIKNRDQITKEISQSKTKLEKRFNIDVKYFAYPRGRYTSLITKQVKDVGYILALTMDDSIITTQTKNHLIPRVGLNSSHTIAEAIDSTSPTVILFRGLLKELLKKIKYL